MRFASTYLIRNTKRFWSCCTERRGDVEIGGGVRELLTFDLFVAWFDDGIFHVLATFRFSTN